MSRPVSEQCREFVEMLKTIISVSGRNGSNQPGTPAAQAEDQLARFSLWAGNIGAWNLESSPLSLESRLQNERRILSHVQELLDDMLGVSRELQDVRGSEENDELDLLEEIGDCITRLFRVSSLIRQASPTDLFVKALTRVRYRYNDEADITHVGVKHPKLATEESDWLRKRLGRAITQRRHYLSYIRDHREELADRSDSPQGLDSEDDAESDTTISRSDENDTQSPIMDRIPGLDTLPKGPGNRVECPFCYQFKRFKNEENWKQHVFSDLRSYVCTSVDCEGLYFADINQWFRHEMENHRVTYTCRVCQGRTFNKEGYLLHVKEQHPEMLQYDEEHLALGIARQPMEQIPVLDCPCCSDWIHRVRLHSDISGEVPDGEVCVLPRVFKRHLASHLEQLALFAIPISSGDDAGDDSKAAVGSEVGGPSAAACISSFTSIQQGRREEGKETGFKVVDTRKARLGADHPSALTNMANLASTYGNLILREEAEPLDIEVMEKRKRVLGDGHFGTLTSKVVDAKKDYGWTPLQRAAGRGNETMVKRLLNTGKVDPDDDDISGQTPLRFAVKGGHGTIVRVLLDTGKVDPDAKDILGFTPLHKAAEGGYGAIIKMLLDTGKVDPDAKNILGFTPLHKAAEGGYGAIIKMLLDTGKVDPDAKNRYGRTPLQLAAGEGHNTIIRMLLNTGMVDPDVKDSHEQTPLQWAVVGGHEMIVRMLLETGKVDPDAKDGMGWTPLQLAAKGGHKAIIKMLLDTGKVNPDAKDGGGQTPLQLAAEGGHGAIIKILLDTGKVDPDAKDRDGQTPLQLAARGGHETVVRMLLDTGKVDPDAKDRYGRTLLQLAAERGVK